MKLRLHVEKTPQNADRCRALGAWIREKGWAQSCWGDAKCDMYVIELVHFFPIVLSLHERRMAPTDYCVSLERTSNRPRKGTAKALVRRIMTIETALLTMSDISQMGDSSGRGNRLFVANDFLVTMEALLLLLHTTQEQLVSITCEQQEEGESHEHVHE